MPEETNPPSILADGQAGHFLPAAQQGDHDHDRDNDHDDDNDNGSVHVSGRGLGTRQPQPRRNLIQGWGVDLDRANRPGVPMERTPPRLEGVHWEQPEQQHQHVEVLVSPERPGITPVFGTSAPPAGLSGMLRRLAFRQTENDVRHWLWLLLADRVNVVEGIGQDLAAGHVPNLLAEMGIKAEWRHNRAGLVRKAALATTVAGLAWYLLRRRGERR